MGGMRKSWDFEEGMFLGKEIQWMIELRMEKSLQVYRVPTSCEAREEEVTSYGPEWGYHVLLSLLLLLILNGKVLASLSCSDFLRGEGRGSDEFWS
jgi:hypothetical protein